MDKQERLDAEVFLASPTVDEGDSQGCTGRVIVEYDEYASAKRVVKEYLADHLADDGEEWTNDWLIDSGFVGDTLGLELRDEETGWAIAVTHVHNRWDYMGRYIKRPKTRGDVRRLCDVLGLKLRTEKEAAKS